MPLHVEQNSGRLILSIPASGDLPRSWFSGQRMWLWPAHDVDTAPRTNTMLTSVFGALFKPSVTSTHKDLKPQMSGITWRKIWEKRPQTDIQPGNILLFYLMLCLTFYRTYILPMFWLSIRHFIWHLLFDNVSQIYAHVFGILSGIHFDILSGRYFDKLSGILVDI